MLYICELSWVYAYLFDFDVYLCEAREDRFSNVAFLHRF